MTRKILLALIPVIGDFALIKCHLSYLNLHSFLDIEFSHSTGGENKMSGSQANYAVLGFSSSLNNLIIFQGTQLELWL